MPFKKAVKQNAKLRMAIAGIAGSGKTLTALIEGTALANGGGVAVIDTEHGSASKYADEFEFDVLELSNFDPRNYIKAIHEAEQAGYAVLIIDSLSHAWNGTGGALELVDTVAKRAAAKRNKDPNSFNAWGEVTPLQNRLIDTILKSPLHIIATMRSKTEYVVKTIEGKSVPQKLGMAPIQRADVEYEFDIYADMDADNTMIIQKSRCRALSGQIIPKPNADLAEVIRTWLVGTPVVQAEEPSAPSASVTESPAQQKQPSLGEQIKQAKLRASSLGLAKDAAEWAALLKTCRVSAIKSAADLEKVVAHLDAFERDQAASTTDTSESLDMASEQQVSTIKKLCGYLNREVPTGLSTMTFEAAGKLLKELSDAYKEARQAIPVR